MTFEQLLATLKDCPGPDVLPVNNNPGGLQYVATSLTEFVGPDLLPSGGIDQPNNPRVIIISAAGAAGKTTLGREIAFHKKASLWDLSKYSAVGGDSMAGQLTASFGFARAANVTERLGKGELFLIVDALDEARVKANEAGFEAFIGNIGAMAKETNGTSFVLLARTQTAETIWLLLSEAQVPAALLSIQPFTRQQAERYIEARIRHFDQAAARRIEDHRGPFIKARDLILDRLERAVGGERSLNDQTTREFLGYAPVLETVAVLLAREGNYNEIIADLSGQGVVSSVSQMDRPLTVLHHVVSRLLDREQRSKLQMNIRPALEKVAADAGWSGWDTLYSPEEQAKRLLAITLGIHLDASPPMPAPVRARYEEQIDTFVREHPFLREGREPANKVFESYLFALAMRQYETSLSKEVEKRVGARDYKPSRLLADFYFLLGEQGSESVVAERQIGLLYDSLLAGETDSLRIRLSLDAGDPDDTDEEAESGQGEFELVYASALGNDEEQVESRSFKIAGNEGYVCFRRQLKDAAITTRRGVRLGGDVDDFEIGPAVSIRCAKLEILSVGLVVRGGKQVGAPADAVVLEAGESSSTISRPPVVRGQLSVHWPGARAYPWTDYAVVSEDVGIGGDEMHEVHRRFRRIVTALRSHRRGSLARLRDKIDHRRVVKNDIGRALLAKLVSDGIMKIEGRFYHWVPEQADRLLGVSWYDFQQRRLTPRLNDYLAAFVRDNANLFTKRS